MSGGAEKGNRNSAIYAGEKSDASIVPKKPPNKGQPTEEVEGRGAAKGNAGEPPAGRTQSRETASMGLEGIRETAKRDRRVKFTALLHHICESASCICHETARIFPAKTCWNALLYKHSISFYSALKLT